MRKRLCLLLLPAMLFCLGFCETTTVVVAKGRHDNGLHKGWYKNTSNPHHPSREGNSPTRGKGKH